MMCYRDMTFCPFEDCNHFGPCHRSLTEEVIADAERWMKDAPIARFTSPPDCFEVKDED